MKTCLFAAAGIIIASPWLAATAPAPSGARTSPEPLARFERLFVPLRTDTAALSPDGRYLAYSVYRNGEMSVNVIDLNEPGKLKTHVNVLSDEDATPFLRKTKDEDAARIWWMHWMTSDRLVMETNAHPLYSPAGVLVGFNADGSNARTLVTPRDIEMYIPNGQPRLRLFPQRGDDVDRFSVNRPRFMGRPDHYRAQTPHFFDFLPEHTGSFTIYSRIPAGAPDLTVYRYYRVNPDNGRVKENRYETVQSQYDPMVDRQGRIRIAITPSIDFPFPHPYLYDTGALFHPWKPLDSLINEPVKAAFEVSPDNYFEHRAIPAGFDENPDILYYFSNVGRDTFGLYGVNLKTGKRTPFSYTNPNFDLIDPSSPGFVDPSPLVYDRYTRQLIGIRYNAGVETTHWFRPAFQTAQNDLLARFPGQNVRLLSWDRSGKQFLVEITGPTYPGAFYVYHADTHKIFELAPRTKWADDPLHYIRPVAFRDRAGEPIYGFVVIPSQAHTIPVPLVVRCADEPWQRFSTRYDPETLALADMGFAVMEINPRGTWGLGVKFRNAVHQDDFARLQTEDILEAINFVSAHYPISKSQVAIMGRQRGAYLALYALQSHPDRFRAGVTLDPTLNLKSWIDEAKWTRSSFEPELTRAYFKGLNQGTLPTEADFAKGIIRPLYIDSFRARLGYAGRSAYIQSRALARALRSRRIPVEFYDYDVTNLQTTSDNGQTGQRPLQWQTQAANFRNIENFLNQHLYNFKVNLGEPETLNTVPEPKKAPEKQLE